VKQTLSAPSGAIFFQVLLFSALAGLGLYFDHSGEAGETDVKRVANWAVTSQDHGGQPFVVVDKPHARLFAFDAHGRLQGSAPVVVEGVNGFVASGAKTELSLQVEEDFYRRHFQSSAGQVRVAYFVPAGAEADFVPSPSQPRRPS